MTSSPTSSSSLSPLSSTDYKTLRRCLDWRYKVESASFAEDEKGHVVGTDRVRQIGLTFAQTMQINTKVANAIASLQTQEEAETFLNVADNIRAERAAELAMLCHLLEQCRREMRVLESKVAVAQGRVIDADRGIAAMRQFMTDKGLAVVTSLDLLAVIRLCIAMRQLREEQHRRHLAKSDRGPSEDPSLVRNMTATLLVVYGGEALTAPYLGYQPSFMLSGTFPMLYTIIQAIVDFMPVVPTPAASSELPLALLDGVTRAYLLCNLIPPVVTNNTSLLLAHSPWALLLTSLITANGGFFLVNLFSFLEPTPLAVQTPPEILPYGWTTADLWCAPVATGLYALLTHAQPFWADFHNTLYGLLGVTIDGKQALPVDSEVARATCAVLLALLFTGRTARKFGLINIASVSTSKIKTQ